MDEDSTLNVSDQHGTMASIHSSEEKTDDLQQIQSKLYEFSRLDEEYIAENLPKQESTITANLCESVQPIEGDSTEEVRCISRFSDCKACDESDSLQEQEMHLKNLFDAQQNKEKCDSKSIAVLLDKLSVDITEIYRMALEAVCSKNNFRSTSNVFNKSTQESLLKEQIKNSNPLFSNQISNEICNINTVMLLDKIKDDITAIYQMAIKAIRQNNNSHLETQIFNKLTQESLLVEQIKSSSHLINLEDNHAKSECLLNCSIKDQCQSYLLESTSHVSSKLTNFSELDMMISKSHNQTSDIKFSDKGSQTDREKLIDNHCQTDHIYISKNQCQTDFLNYLERLSQFNSEKNLEKLIDTVKYVIKNSGILEYLETEPDVPQDILCKPNASQHSEIVRKDVLDKPDASQHSESLSNVKKHLSENTDISEFRSDTKHLHEKQFLGSLENNSELPKDMEYLVGKWENLKHSGCKSSITNPLRCHSNTTECLNYETDTKYCRLKESDQNLNCQSNNVEHSHRMVISQCQSEKSKHSNTKSGEMMLPKSNSHNNRFCKACVDRKQILRCQSNNSYPPNDENDILDSSKNDMYCAYLHGSETVVLDLSDNEGKSSDISDDEKKFSDIFDNDVQFSRLSASDAKSSDISDSSEQSPELSESDTQSSYLSSSGTQSSDLSDSGTQSSNLSDSRTQSSDLSDSRTQSSDLSDSRTQSSDLSDSITQSSDLFDSITQSSDLFDSITQSSDLFDSITQSSDLFDSRTQSSDLSDSITQSSDLFGSSTQSSGLFDSRTQFSDLSDSRTQSSDLFGSGTQSSYLSNSDTISSDLSDSDTLSSDLSDTEYSYFKSSHGDTTDTSDSLTDVTEISESQDDTFDFSSMHLGELSENENKEIKSPESEQTECFRKRRDITGQVTNQTDIVLQLSHILENPKLYEITRISWACRRLEEILRNIRLNEEDNNCIQVVVKQKKKLN